MQHYDVCDEPVTDLAFHASGAYMLTASADAKLKVCGPSDGHLFSPPSPAAFPRRLPPPIGMSPRAGRSSFLARHASPS